MYAHPNDLRLILATRADPHAPISWKESGLLNAFVRVCELIEPDLIWSDDPSRIFWLTSLANAQFYIAAWREQGGDRDLKLNPVHTDQLASLATKAWRGPSKGPIKPLPFIANQELRSIAERDLASLIAARKADEVKMALVLAGSVIETALTDIIERDQSVTEAAARRVAQAKNWRGFEPTDTSKWKFYQQISICGSHGLQVLSDKTEAISHTVRDWRNFVHPDRERQELRNGSLRPSDAAVAEALVEKVLDEVAAWSKKSQLQQPTP